MPFIGHWHALEVAKHQPVKMAAFENVTDDAGQRAAVPVRLGAERRRHHDTHGVSIPSGLSLMLGSQPGARGHGASTASRPQDRPPEQIVFQSYHLMIALVVPVHRA